MPSVIHSVRTTVQPVAITILTWKLFCEILKSGHGRAKIVIIINYCGSASWIKNVLLLLKAIVVNLANKIWNLYPFPFFYPYSKSEQEYLQSFFLTLLQLTFQTKKIAEQNNVFYPLNMQTVFLEYLFWKSYLYYSFIIAISFTVPLNKEFLKL